jgi:hypothetical protein
MATKQSTSVFKVVFYFVFFFAVFPLQLYAQEHYITANYCYTSKGILITNMEIECDSLVIDGKMEREIRDMLRTMLEKYKGIKQHIRFKCLINASNIMENVTFLNQETEQLFKKYDILRETKSSLTKFTGSTVTFSFSYNRMIK